MGMTEDKKNEVRITFDSVKAWSLFGVKKEVNFTANFGEIDWSKPHNINYSYKDETKIIPVTREKLLGSWKFLKEQISKGLAHLRELNDKRFDNKQTGEWLKDVREKKGEQSLEVKPKHGAEIKYKKGAESENTVKAEGEPAIEKSKAKEEPEKDKSEKDTPEKEEKEGKTPEEGEGNGGEGD